MDGTGGWIVSFLVFADLYLWCGVWLKAVALSRSEYSLIDMDPFPKMIVNIYLEVKTENIQPSVYWPNLFNQQSSQFIYASLMYSIQHIYMYCGLQIITSEIKHVLLFVIFTKNPFLNIP